MAYLRKEKETVEIDYPLDKVWAAVLKVVANLKWTIKVVGDKAKHVEVKTQGSFMSYPSVLKIDGFVINENIARVKVIAETPVTTITSIADFGRTRYRIELFFEALAKQLADKRSIQ